MKGEIKLVAIILVVISTVVVLLGGGQKGTAYDVNTTGNATITLTVASKTMIDITPQVLNYTTQDPGTEVINYTYDTRNISQVQIENVGSTNLTNIWFNTTQPSSNPFGTGSASNYDAGNFLAVKNSTMGTSEFAFVDRLEWNHTTNIVYLKLPTSNYQRQGRLHVGPNEYFWATASEQSENPCNGSASQDYIYVGSTAHTVTETGDVDLTNGNTALVVSGDSSWSVASSAVSIGSASYCVAVSADCSQVRFYRWNADAPGTSTCPLDERYSTTTLYPGDSFAVDVRLYVPYGVAAGTLTNGTLTVLATAE